MRLGIVASAHNASGPPVVQGQLTGAFLQAAGDVSDTASYAFANQPLGPTHAARIIVVAVTARKVAPSATISSITIGGVSATVAVTSTQGGNTAAIAYATVPTGSTGTVVVNWSAVVLRCGLAMWSIRGAAATVTTASAFGAVGTSITGTTNGFVIAASGNTADSQTYTWAGVTKRYEAAVEVFTHSGGDSTETGELIVRGIPSAAATNEALVVAAFAPD